MQQEPLPFDVGPSVPLLPRAPGRRRPRSHQRDDDTPRNTRPRDDHAGGDPSGGGPAPEVVDNEQRWPFSVRVIRSTKRKRSVGAQMRGDVLTITVPSWMSRAEEAVWRDRMAERYRRKMDAERIDLRERSTTLARRYDLPRPREIKWADEMKSQWGSCTPSTSSIRLSSRLAAFPNWVLDYVIVHELAHLVVLAHNEEFWRIVYQYPKAERAIGYLIARSDDAEDID